MAASTPPSTLAICCVTVPVVCATPFGAWAESKAAPHRIPRPRSGRSRWTCSRMRHSSCLDRHLEGVTRVCHRRGSENHRDRHHSVNAERALDPGRDLGEASPVWPWRAILRDLGAPEGLLQEGPAQERFASFQAVLHHLRSGSIDAPSVIVVDDAHLADSASLLLVRFLVRERGLALLML